MRLQLAALDGSGIRDVQLPTLGSLFGLGMEPDGNEVLFGFSSFTVPPSVYRAGPGYRHDRRCGAASRRTSSRSASSVSQVEYPSADGTRITMFLVHRRDVERNGRQPTFLTGYGGFNISHDPGLLALDAALARVGRRRGDTEPARRRRVRRGRGTRTGMLRQEAEHVRRLHRGGRVAHRLPAGPARAQLAIQGGSNGGLLMGAVLTQRPELFRAVVVQVPAARHAALSPIPDRPAVDSGVRLGRRPGAVRAGCRRTRRIITCAMAWPTPRC